MAKIGFLGLGAMGGGMAARLAEQGLDVTVYNRTTEKSEAVARQGATVAGTPAEAAHGADVVFVSLATSEVVQSVLFGDGGVVEVLPGGAIVADLSTVAPGAARAQAARLAETGHRALDACVIGNARHAREGELRFLLGGAAAEVEEISPVLRHLAKDIVHLGDHGKGATAKIALNLLMGVQMQALAEAITFGERAGLDRRALIDLIAASGYSSPVMRFKSGVMARRAFEKPDFRLSLMRKDLGLVLTEAQDLGVPMPATAASHQWLTAAVHQGLGDHDCAAVLATAESLTGVTGYPWPGDAS